MTDSFIKAFGLMRRNAAQVIFVTMILMAVYFAYGSVIYISGCLFIPGLIGENFRDINLPESFSPAVICIIAAGAVFGYMIVTPLSFGADWCFYQAAKGMPIPLECLFTCVIDKYRRRKVWLISVVSTGSKMLIVTACAALFRAFGTAYSEAAETGSSAEIFALMYAGTGIIAALLLSGFFLLSVRYFMVPYVFAEDPDKDVRMILSESVKLVESHRREIIILWISFLPMYILCISGFPYLIAIPAVHSVNAVCAARFIGSGAVTDETLTVPQRRQT